MIGYISVNKIQTLLRWDVEKLDKESAATADIRLLEPGNKLYIYICVCVCVCVHKWHRNMSVYVLSISGFVCVSSVGVCIRMVYSV